MGLAAARDEGLLKRVRGTPLPMWMYLTAWVTAAVAVGIGAVAVLFAVSVPAFGLHIYADSLLPAIVTLLLGAACLSALGVAVATLVKSVDQAQPVVQLTFLPLSFISGFRFPLDGAPDWLVSVAEAFPLYHLAQAFGIPSTPCDGVGAAASRGAGDLDGRRAADRSAPVPGGELGFVEEWSVHHVRRIGIPQRALSSRCRS